MYAAIWEEQRSFYYQCIAEWAIPAMVLVICSDQMPVLCPSYKVCSGGTTIDDYAGVRSRSNFRWPMDVCFLVR